MPIARIIALFASGVEFGMYGCATATVPSVHVAG